MAKSVEQSIVHDPEALIKAMQVAVRKALRRHKLLGNAIAEIDKNGNAVLIQPEDLVIPDEEP